MSVCVCVNVCVNVCVCVSVCVCVWCVCVVCVCKFVYMYTYICMYCGFGHAGFLTLGELKKDYVPGCWSRFGMVAAKQPQAIEGLL